MSTSQLDLHTDGPPRTSRQRVQTLRQPTDESTGPTHRRLPPGILIKSPGPVSVCQRVDRSLVKIPLTEYPDKTSGPYTHTPRNKPDSRTDGPVPGVPIKSPDPTPENLQTIRTPTRVVSTGHPDKESGNNPRVPYRHPELPRHLDKESRTRTYILVR